MKEEEVKKHWNRNAEAWTKLARKGRDLYRDNFNTPAFLKMLPDVRGLKGLDVGCGEGNNTRLVAQRGADMTAVDIADVFVRHANEMNDNNTKINYLNASGMRLPFKNETFDFCMATMSLMDMPDQKEAIEDICRVLKPGGFLQFSISHPCFFTPKFEKVYDENNSLRGFVCGDYFTEQESETVEWMFGNVTEQERDAYSDFVIPVFRLSLSKWLNMLINAGFTLEEFCEPYPDKESVEKDPYLQPAEVISFFLIIRCRKN